MIPKKRFAVIAAALIAAGEARASDVGEFVDGLLEALSYKHFGFIKPTPGPTTVAVPRAAGQPASQRQQLAKGLTARFVSRQIAVAGDMIAFWPNDVAYTHLIVCIEQGRFAGNATLAPGNNASVQRVSVNTGAVETILYGMSVCDGIRTTPWGSVLATEETSTGRAYEILDPLGTTGHWVADRATGDIRDGINSPTASSTIAQRQSLPTMAWEGIMVLPNGVVIAGDELRPGTGAADADGGAIFRFVPDAPFDCQGELATPGAVCENPVTDLAQSPLVSGHVYALQVECTTGVQYGQGCEVGDASWLEVNALTARADADSRGASGYYRPEDLHRDPSFGPTDQTDLSEGVRFCWANTGNSDANNFAEVMCAVDQSPEAGDEVVINSNDYLSPDGVNRAITTVTRFIQGDDRFNSHDNLEFQPISGNLYVIEDDTFGEVFACLPDGRDRNHDTDGCVSMLGINDPEGEPTGFIFDGTGRAAFYIVQHGEQPAALLDFTSNPVNGETDDLIRITGFRDPSRLEP
jgi:secreted PhoX family phosphatase